MQLASPIWICILIQVFGKFNFNPDHFEYVLFEFNCLNKQTGKKPIQPFTHTKNPSFCKEGFLSMISELKEFLMVVQTAKFCVER
jgi:hypothetical protein